MNQPKEQRCELGLGWRIFVGVECPRCGWEGKRIVKGTDFRRRYVRGGWDARRRLENEMLAQYEMLRRRNSNGYCQRLMIGVPEGKDWLEHGYDASCNMPTQWGCPRCKRLGTAKMLDTVQIKFTPAMTEALRVVAPLADDTPLCIVADWFEEMGLELEARVCRDVLGS